MKCVVCKHGETKTGLTTITLERGRLTMVVRDVPAEVCDNCGEAYLSTQVADDLNEMGNRANDDRAQFEVRQYSRPAIPA